MPSALATDLYEITMVAGYHAHHLNGLATFELYVRELPPTRAFLVAAGLDQALDYLEGLRFTPENIRYLRQLPNLRGVASTFFDEYLPAFRFSGEVWAIAEGTPVFPPAPLLRITAPLPEAQLAETALLSILMFQTGVASKAARVVLAGRGRSIIEFGSRRAHGIDAAAFAARAAFIGGCEATSNVEAGLRFGIPLSGTMAHSWVTGFSSEREAFDRYTATFGDRAVLLLDTFDTLEAARLVVRSGLKPSAVRLDSGDLAALASEVRGILDAGGLTSTKILVSGDLDEARIAAMTAADAPIDGFGVGAAISTVTDSPALGVYKLVEIERNGGPVGVAKLSANKQTWPFRKQVWRRTLDGVAAGDVIGLANERPPASAVPLLERVMVDGRRSAARPSVTDLRRRSLAQIAQLPGSVHQLEEPDRYPVSLSDALQTAGRDVAVRAARR
jgi:nicotinate phosphoribosyltransferase